MSVSGWYIVLGILVSVAATYVAIGASWTNGDYALFLFILAMYFLTRHDQSDAYEEIEKLTQRIKKLETHAG